MPKVYIKFQLPEESEEHSLFMKSGAMASAINDIRNVVFRPARKHGYSDQRMKELVQEIGEGKASELIGRMEELFSEILEENDVIEYS